MTWPPCRIEGEPEEDMLVRRPTEDGGNAKAPALVVVSVLLAMRIGLVLEIADAPIGGDAPGELETAPDPKRESREGLREASAILF